MGFVYPGFVASKMRGVSFVGGSNSVSGPALRGKNGIRSATVSLDFSLQWHHFWPAKMCRRHLRLLLSIARQRVQGHMMAHWQYLKHGSGDGEGVGGEDCGDGCGKATGQCADRVSGARFDGSYNWLYFFVYGGFWRLRRGPGNLTWTCLILKNHFHLDHAPPQTDWNLISIGFLGAPRLSLLSHLGCPC